MWLGFCLKHYGNKNAVVMTTLHRRLLRQSLSSELPVKHITTVRVGDHSKPGAKTPWTLGSMALGSGV